MSMQQRLQIAELNSRDSDESDWFFVQMVKITEGHLLTKIAENYAVSYGVLRNWIASVPERERQYQAALKYKKDFDAAKGVL